MLENIETSHLSLLVTSPFLRPLNVFNLWYSCVFNIGITTGNDKAENIMVATAEKIRPLIQILLDNFISKKRAISLFIANTIIDRLITINMYKAMFWFADPKNAITISNVTKITI
jgi:hypothetical protein